MDQAKELNPLYPSPNIVMDYVEPYIAAKLALKSIHIAMLSKDYERAAKTTVECIANLKLTLNAIRHEQEQQTS